jgi:hypothetical protein
MIANSSMYNEKQALRYQVDTFKDILDEHYETLNQAKRQLKEKSKVKKTHYINSLNFHLFKAQSYTHALRVKICIDILQ